MEASVAAKSLIKIAAVSGSLRQASFNRGLIRSAIVLSKSIEGIQIDYIDMAPLPLINTDLEKDGTFPPAVETFRHKIRDSDCFLFASPEYNYSIAGCSSNEPRIDNEAEENNTSLRKGLLQHQGDLPSSPHLSCLDPPAGPANKHRRLRHLGEG